MLFYKIWPERQQGLFNSLLILAARVLIHPSLPWKMCLDYSTDAREFKWNKNTILIILTPLLVFRDFPTFWFPTTGPFSYARTHIHIHHIHTNTPYTHPSIPHTHIPVHHTHIPVYHIHIYQYTIHTYQYITYRYTSIPYTHTSIPHTHPT